ncbi:formate C-acetyltransferase/glycerol dehydratase family glycyl radical enzyme [Oscillibacter sp.]|uniref:glycyl radical protein n=1 Tax=Oscillibacter sp. TaxID=1945593 RepID=UPI002618FD3B|nr:formate C-acetyltransferase/glycerol dehydratase family glycyl radical enzyme [Oscillibacter sp.]MDD3347852.1 formate C-acetyltransferase/glycerol dehydratase family glycyl radical enzyme [Oscillibacter sp.]
MKLSRKERVERIRKQVHIDRTVDTARARLVTESYRETEGMASPLRRAKALQKILGEMPIYIHDGQLLVGNQGERSRAGLIFPEFQWDATLSEMESWATRPGDKFAITPEQVAELKELLQYWKGRTVRDRANSVLPESVQRSLQYGIISNANYLMSGHGHFIPDFPKILEKGFHGVRREIEERMAALDQTAADYYRKQIFYQGELETIKAVEIFAARYAELAEKTAAETEDADRREELARIARNCRRVPMEPARDYWEALQCIWFVQVIPQIEVNGLSVCLGRMDQYLYPYYLRDKQAELLDDDKALELLDCLYLQTATITKIYSNEGAMIFAGPGVGQTITLSGVDKNGKDVTNELSYLCIDADEDVRLMQPDIAVRNHPLIPERFLKKCCAHAAAGRDKPKFFTDRVIIQSLQNAGIPLEDARDYGDLGCSEIIVCGKTCSGGNMGNLCMAMCFDLAMHDGVQHWYYDGKDFHPDIHLQMGPHTGDPRTFRSMEDLRKAYSQQVRYFVKQLAILDNVLDNIQTELVPHVFYSLIVDGCIDSGRDFTGGGAIYNHTSPLAAGPITASDSLAAVKKAVFEDRMVSMEELLRALDSNFAGESGEELRQMLIKRVPKFGNDDDAADEEAVFVVRDYYESMQGYENPRGGKWVPSVYNLTGNVGFGWRTGPTPDGRVGGELLNDNICPMQGRDLNGPTSVVKSLSKIDASLLPQGYVFNLKFAPNIVNNEENLKKFVSFNHSLNDYGIFHVQYNILDGNTLLDAQQHPEKHKDLLIRVSGYSAYFVELGKDVQDHLIHRTLHTI